jgi:hypothetical protein
MRVLGKEVPLPSMPETAADDSPNSGGSFVLLSPDAGEHSDAFSTAVNEPVTVEDEPDDLLQQQPASPVAPVPQAHVAAPPAAVPETCCQRQARAAAAKLKDIDWKYWALQVAKFIAQLAVFGILARGVIPPTSPALSSTSSSASSSSSTDAALYSRVASLEQLVREQGAQLLVSFV